MTMRLAVVAVLALGALSSTASAQFDSTFHIIYTPHVQGPPYPTQPVGVHLLDGRQPAPPVIADFGMGLRTLSLNGLPPGEPVLGTLDAIPGDTDPMGNRISSFFDVFVDIQAAPPGQFVDSFFDVFTELSVPGQPSGTTYPIIRFDVPLVHDSFFDVFVEVQLPSGVLPLHLHGESSPGVRFNPGTGAGFMPDSFFDVFVDITFDRAMYQPGSPAMRMTLDGTIPTPGAAGMLVLGALMASRRRR